MNHSTLSAFAGAFTLNIAATTLLIAAGAAHAAESGVPEFSANVAYTTDYRSIYGVMAEVVPLFDGKGYPAMPAAFGRCRKPESAQCS